MTSCDDCKEKRCIDTACRTCFPKEDKALYQGLMAGDSVEFKPVKNYIDSKGMA